MSDKIRAILGEVCWINPADVDGQRDLIEYGLDFARTMDLIVALEDRFDIEIPDDAIAGLRTLNDIVAFVQAAKEAA